MQAEKLWNLSEAGLIGSLSPSVSGGGPRFFCGLSLIPLALLFLRFILRAQTKPGLPTNAAAAFQGQSSGGWWKKTTGEEQGRREDEAKGDERRRKKKELQRREERSTQFHPLRRSLAAPCSQYPTSRRPYSETHLMNTPALIQPHNGVLHSHWARSQWWTSPQLNPRDNKQGKVKGVEVCV